MEFILFPLLLIVLVMGLGHLLRRNRTNPSEPSPYELPILPLREQDERFFVEYEGARYVAYEGEKTASRSMCCHWHGRLGEGIGLLKQEGTSEIVGELYHLKEDERNVLLAHLPREGYPLTDMLLLLREETLLPPIAPDAFSYGEVYKVLGEVPEEELEKKSTVTDPLLLSALILAWTEGTQAVLPQGEYERYRIRLYSRDRQGLYVNVSLNVCREQNCFAVEKQGFEGDVLLSPSQGLSITNK